MLVTVGAELAPTVTFTVPLTNAPAGSSARTVTVVWPAATPVRLSTLPVTVTVTRLVFCEVAV